MITVAYFTVTTTIRDHSISEMTPMMDSVLRPRAEAAPSPCPKA